jgi:hypothetical protein
MSIPDVVVNGIPLIFVVLGLVEWVKQLGVSGKGTVAASMAIGVGLGIGYQCSVVVPTDFATWFGAGIFGLALGLVASGIYDAASKVASKAATKG